MCALLYDNNYIKKVINKLEEDLFPSLGNLTKHEIYGYQCLTFSEIYSVKLYFKQSVKNIILKKYLKEKRANDDQLSVEREYNILNYLYQRFLSDGSINVIQPITFLPEEDILVTKEFLGDKLNNLIANEIRWIPYNRKKKRVNSYVFQCGRWLKYFQEFTKRDEVLPFRQDWYVENIRNKLDFSAKYGLEDNLKKKIYRFIDNKFKKIGNQQLELVGFHGDFTPWNVLASDNEIGVLDLDRFSYKNRYDDLTLFLCCLEGKKSVVGMTNKNINILKEAFLQGYDTEKINRDIFNLYILKNTLKMLNWIDTYKNANTEFFDILYEKYRKKRLIRVCLNSVEQLTNESLNKNYMFNNRRIKKMGD